MISTTITTNGTTPTTENGTPIPFREWQGDNPLPPDADSRVLVVRPLGPEFRPTSPRSMPGGNDSYVMKREHAEAMAVMLNRELLEDPSRSTVWFVVAYHTDGFRTIQVEVPHKWKPVDEYDTPPGSCGPGCNAQCRQSAIEFNRKRVEEYREGRRVTEWAIHLKPLRRPDETIRKEPATVELSTVKQSIVDTIDAAGVQTELVDGGVNLWFSLHFPEEMDWQTEAWKRHDAAGRLRDMAARLVDAANSIDGETGPGLSLMTPLTREIGVEGFEDVSMLVYNCGDDDELAITKARQALIALR